MQDTQSQLQIGVINPFALAEIKVGHRINWEQVSKPRHLLEQILGFPYEKLFDPKHGSPLYAGLKHDNEIKMMVRDESDPYLTAKTNEEALLTVLKKTVKEHDESKATDVLHTKHKLRSLLKAKGAKNDKDISIEDYEHIKKELREEQSEALSQINPHVLKTLHVSGGGGGGGGGLQWVDPGQFFTDATSPLDIIQGGLGDCYYVAALASVAWAHPYTISQRNRQTDVSGQFTTPTAVDLILFWNTTTNAWDRVEVTELLPMIEPGNNYIYARCDDPNEIWVPVYEKAYAMWRTGDTTNQPDYNPIAGGDPVGAAVSLTGLNGSYFGTEGDTSHNIWQNVRSHSLSRHTFDPMVAWTYGSDADAPTPINYANANIVANHAYSILGWDYFNGDEYIVLRNPWGSTEATLDIESGTWYAYDGSFWYPVTLSSQGIFALRADIFQQYYAGYGFVTGNDTFPSF